MFQNLLNLPKQAMFALVNERDKKVYVSFSSTFHVRLGSILGQFRDGSWRWKDMIRDRKKLSLVIIETNVQKNFVKYFKDAYRNEGYELYNETEKLPLWYEFKINYTTRKVLVVAVNARNDKIVLGRFDTYEEARGFLFYIKHNNPTNSLCYSMKGRL